MEEKVACVEKYIYGLQLSYFYENPCCNHDTVIEIELATTLKEESMLLILMTVLMILFVC
jgi:hypothetical protein